MTRICALTLQELIVPLASRRAWIWLVISTTDPGVGDFVRYIASTRITALSLFDDPQVLVLDLDGIAFTPSTLQELIVPLAQRIRGGEHGTVWLVISTTDPGVGDFVRYIAQVHELPLYLSSPPSDLRQATPVGNLTTTERSTLDTIIELGGQVTASRLAATEGIKPSAATNRLVRLDQEGYLVRQPRGRREGDAYIEPRSATPIYTVSDTGTGSAHLPGSTLSIDSPLGVI